MHIGNANSQTAIFELNSSCRLHGLETQHHIPELDFIARLQPLGQDALAVHEGARLAVLILNEPGPLGVAQAKVLPGNGWIGKTDMADCASPHPDIIPGEGIYHARLRPVQHAQAHGRNLLYGEHLLSGLGLAGCPLKPRPARWRRLGSDFALGYGFRPTVRTQEHQSNQDEKGTDAAQ